MNRMFIFSGVVFFIGWRSPGFKTDERYCTSGFYGDAGSAQCNRSFSIEKKQGGKTIERTLWIIDGVSKDALLLVGKKTLPKVSKESPAGLVRKPALDSKDSWDPITKLKQSNITKTFRPNSIEFRLAEILFDLIKGRKSDFKKPNLQVWVKDIDRMIRLDKRTPDRIEAVIRWCQQDDFWQNNILSPGKLRDKFDQLDLKMQSKTGGSVNTKLPPKPPTCFRCRLPATKQFPHKSGPIGMCSECYKHLSSAPDFVTHKGKTIKKWAIDKGQLEVMIEKQKAKTGRRQTCINPVAVESKVGVECYA